MKCIFPLLKWPGGTDPLGENSLKRIPFGNLAAFLCLSPLPPVRSCQADEREVSPQPWGLREARSKAQESLCPFVYRFFSLSRWERGGGAERHSGVVGEPLTGEKELDEEGKDCL